MVPVRLRLKAGSTYGNRLNLTKKRFHPVLHSNSVLCSFKVSKDPSVVIRYCVSTQIDPVPLPISAAVPVGRDFGAKYLSGGHTFINKCSRDCTASPGLKPAATQTEKMVRSSAHSGMFYSPPPDRILCCLKYPPSLHQEWSYFTSLASASPSSKGSPHHEVTPTQNLPHHPQPSVRPPSPHHPA